MTPSPCIEIVEVAPRDGFQSVEPIIPTETKIQIIEGLIASGLTRIEFGSFVSPRAIPQMADMADIARHFRDESRARLSALVPNVKGAELALKNGVREIVYVFSASEAHNRSNVGAPIAKSIQGLADVSNAIAGEDIVLRVDLATAFDCPLDGTVALDAVLQALHRSAGSAGRNPSASNPYRMPLTRQELPPRPFSGNRSHTRPLPGSGRHNTTCAFKRWGRRRGMTRPLFEEKSPHAPFR